jgi:hypothetical protein
MEESELQPRVKMSLMSPPCKVQDYISDNSFSDDESNVLLTKRKSSTKGNTQRKSSFPLLSLGSGRKIGASH